MEILCKLWKISMSKPNKTFKLKLNIWDNMVINFRSLMLKLLLIMLTIYQFSRKLMKWRQMNKLKK